MHLIFFSQIYNLLYSVEEYSVALSIRMTNDRPLVREGTSRRQESKFKTTTFGHEVISGHKSQSGFDTSTYI
jgi:hypothetical protein